MKTYTIEQIKKYIESQDSLGDVLYNLKKIDEYLKNPEVFEFEDEDDLNNFLCDLEENQGNTFMWNNITYLISDTVTDFIRTYGRNGLSNINYNIKSLLANGLIIEE